MRCEVEQPELGGDNGERRGRGGEGRREPALMKVMVWVVS